MSAYYPEIGNVPVLARLSISNGDTWQRSFSLKTGAADGPSVDLTDSVITSVVVKDLDGETMFAPTVTMADDLTTGEFTLAIDSEMSEQLVAGSYDCDAAGQYWLLIRRDSTTILKVLLQCLPGIKNS